MPFFRRKWQIPVLNIAVNLLVAANMVCIGQFGSTVFFTDLAAMISTISALYKYRKQT